MNNIATRLFTDEERQLLNGITNGVRLDKLTREYVLQSVVFSRQMTSDEATMFIDLLDDLADKLAHDITDEEWNTAKKLLPFPVSVSFEDIIEADQED